MGMMRQAAFSVADGERLVAAARAAEKALRSGPTLPPFAADSGVHLAHVVRGAEIEADELDDGEHVYDGTVWIYGDGGWRELEPDAVFVRSPEIETELDADATYLCLAGGESTYTIDGEEVTRPTYVTDSNSPGGIAFRMSYVMVCHPDGTPFYRDPVFTDFPDLWARNTLPGSNIRRGLLVNFQFSHIDFPDLAAYNEPLSSAEFGWTLKYLADSGDDNAEEILRRNLVWVKDVNNAELPFERTKYLGYWNGITKAADEQDYANDQFEKLPVYIVDVGTAGISPTDNGTDVEVVTNVVCDPITEDQTVTSKFLSGFVTIAGLEFPVNFTLTDPS